MTVFELEKHPRSFPEDYPEGNGKWLNGCKVCEQHFIGRATRTLCKLCENALAVKARIAEIKEKCLFEITVTKGTRAFNTPADSAHELAHLVVAGCRTTLAVIEWCESFQKDMMELMPDKNETDTRAHELLEYVAAAWLPTTQQ